MVDISIWNEIDRSYARSSRTLTNNYTANAEANVFAIFIRK